MERRRRGSNLLAPIVAWTQGEYQGTRRASKRGFQRGEKIDERMYENCETRRLGQESEATTSAVVVDRIVVLEGIGTASGGFDRDPALELPTVWLLPRTRKPANRPFFRPNCPVPSRAFLRSRRSSPGSFSPSTTPFGALPGPVMAGTKVVVDPIWSFPDHNRKALPTARFAPWSNSSSPYMTPVTLDAIAPPSQGFTTDAGPIAREKFRKVILFRIGQTPTIKMKYDDGLRTYERASPFRRRGDVTSNGVTRENRESSGTRESAISGHLGLRNLQGRASQARSAWPVRIKRQAHQ